MPVTFSWTGFWTAKGPFPILPTTTKSCSSFNTKRASFG
jgi:hypothetical protein